MFGLSELALILIVVAVVVGVKKLPELTRSAGKAARILKSETKALKEEGKEQGRAPDAAAPGERHVVTGIVVERNDPPVRDSHDRP
ncbi:MULTISPECIES: twin-arginine translocase TatA/TatE family subunit [unclassified Streptomyces]